MSILIKGVEMPTKHFIKGFYIDGETGNVLDISRKSIIGHAVRYWSGMTNLQIVVKKISEFCGNCPKNNSDCNLTDGDYCQDLAKYIIDLQSKMTSASQNT